MGQTGLEFGAVPTDKLVQRVLTKIGNEKEQCRQNIDTAVGVESSTTASRGDRRRAREARGAYEQVMTKLTEAERAVAAQNEQVKSGRGSEEAFRKKLIDTLDPQFEWTRRAWF